MFPYSGRILGVLDLIRRRKPEVRAARLSSIFCTPRLGVTRDYLGYEDYERRYENGYAENGVGFCDQL
jgi:hypothetical protein